MPNTLTLTSPAKINLYLKVKGKRKDGFHDIVTVFERIDLCDRLSFTTNATGRITIACDHPQVPTGPKNLVHRVARLLQTRYNVSQGVDIRIQKVIPVAAGLAGGSSNAATTLLALNRLWHLELDQRALVLLSGEIGSDVAFFLYDCSWALGTGRGNEIQVLKLPRKLTHILVVPCVKLYAAEVYGALKFKLTRYRDNVNILFHHLRNNRNDISSLIINDLESAIIKMKPGLQKLKQRLKTLGAEGVMISGSGPAVFGLTRDSLQAQRLKRILLNTYSRVFVVRTL